MHRVCWSKSFETWNLSSSRVKEWRKSGQVHIVVSTHWHCCVTEDHLFSKTRGKLYRSVKKHEKRILPVLTKVRNKWVCPNSVQARVDGKPINAACLFACLFFMHLNIVRATAAKVCRNSSFTQGRSMAPFSPKIIILHLPKDPLSPTNWIALLLVAQELINKASWSKSRQGIEVFKGGESESVLK